MGGARSGRPPGGAAPGATVLGPTSLDGRDLTPRQRRLVAALVHHRALGVGTDTLIDAVWSDAVPASARQSLQNQIARIRRVHGDEVIVMEASRYHLGRSCDVDELERLTGPWITGPANPAAIPHLQQALGLWCGLPFEDLDDHIGVEAERARLEELRSTTAELLAACQIVGGATKAAVASLTALVAADPYRERPWELLILGLHLQGRRTEALATYHSLAARLATDLRCQPSAPLQRMRETIERGEVIDLRDHLDHSAPTTPASTSRCSRRQQRHRTSCSGSYRQA